MGPSLRRAPGEYGMSSGCAEPGGDAASVSAFGSGVGTRAAPSFAAGRRARELLDCIRSPSRQRTGRATPIGRPRRGRESDAPAGNIAPSGTCPILDAESGRRKYYGRPQMRRRTTLSPRRARTPHRTGPLHLFPEPGMFSSSIRLVRVLLTSSGATPVYLLQGGTAASRILIQLMSLPFLVPWCKNFAFETWRTRLTTQATDRSRIRNTDGLSRPFLSPNPVPRTTSWPHDSIKRPTARR